MIFDVVSDDREINRVFFIQTSFSLFLCFQDGYACLVASLIFIHGKTV